MRRLVRVFAEQNKTSIMIYIVQYNNLFSVMTMLSKMSLNNRWSDGTNNYSWLGPSILGPVYWVRVHGNWE